MKNFSTFITKDDLLNVTQLREVFPKTRWIFLRIGRYLTSVNYFALRGGYFLASAARKLICGEGISIARRGKKISGEGKNSCGEGKQGAHGGLGAEILEFLESFLPKELKSSADGFFAKWKNICLSFMFFIYYIYKERERQKVYTNLLSNLLNFFVKN